MGIKLVLNTGIYIENWYYIFCSPLIIGLWNSVEERGQKEWGDCCAQKDIRCLYQPNRCSADIQRNNVLAG